MSFFTLANINLEELQEEVHTAFKDNIKDIDLEDIKNRKILNLAYECTNEMLSFANEKLDDTHELIKSLKKTKEDIENVLHFAKITTPVVINIVKNIINYRKELEFLGMFFSGMSAFLPTFQILIMFLH